jgi:hypothetical protein
MKEFFAAVGALLVTAAIIFSIIGYRHIVILGVPIALSGLFWIGYVLSRRR